VQLDIQRVIDNMRACRRIEDYNVVIGMYEQAFEPMLKVIEKAAAVVENSGRGWTITDLQNEILAFYEASRV